MKPVFIGETIQNCFANQASEKLNDGRCNTGMRREQVIPERQSLANQLELTCSSVWNPSKRPKLFLAGEVWQTIGMKMSRTFNWILFALSTLMLSFHLTVQPACADDFMPEKFDASQFVEYERQLNALLKTRYDQEKEFVAKIVAQVRLGKIPSRLVSTSYSWVRNKRPDTNYPFVYFERVIRIQAKAINLENEIPKFDYSMYSDGPRSFGQSGNAGQNPATARSSKTATRKNSLFRFGSKR
jgi:hypothetical protein